MKKLLILMVMLLLSGCGAEETFEALFGYFNTLVAPAEEAEPGTGSNILSTVIACGLGIFLAQKIITKRKL